MMNGDQTYLGWTVETDSNDMAYADWVHEVFRYFHTTGRPLLNAEFLAYWQDQWKYADMYTYERNFGGDGNDSYITTFFKVH